MKNLAITSLLLLSACAIGERPESAIYAIRPSDFAEQSCKVDLNLQVAEPTSSPGLDTRRIAVYENKQQLNFYSNARWTAPAPEMLQAALVEGFENSQAFKSVSTDMDSAKSDVILLTDIRDYQVEVNDVKIRYVSKLIDAESRKIITTMKIDKTQAPAAKKMASIVEAFGRGTNDSIKEVIEKTLAAYPKCKSH